MSPRPPRYAVERTPRRPLPTGLDESGMDTDPFVVFLVRSKHAYPVRPSARHLVPEQCSQPGAQALLCVNPA